MVLKNTSERGKEASAISPTTLLGIAKKKLFSLRRPSFSRENPTWLFFFLFRRKWLRRQNVHRKKKIVFPLFFCRKNAVKNFPESHSDYGAVFTEENGRK